MMIGNASLQIRLATDTFSYRYASLEMGAFHKKPWASPHDFSWKGFCL